MATPAAPSTVFVARLNDNRRNAVRWTPVTLDTTGAVISIAAYRVYRGLSPNGLDSVVVQTVVTTDVSGKVDTLAIDNLSDPGANHFYKVTAVAADDTEGEASLQATDIF